MDNTPISFNEYKKIAQLTATYPGKGKNILYPALGLCGEASELYEKYCQCPEWMFEPDFKNFKNIHHKILLVLKECGDWLWYATDIATELDIDLCRKWEDPSMLISVDDGFYGDYLLNLCYRSGKVAEEAKKQMRDGKKIDKNIVTNTLCTGLDIIKLVSNVYCKSDHGLYAVARINNEKLLARRTNGIVNGSGDER